MRTEARRHPHSETGGLLLGYVTGDDVVICSIIGPGPKARSTKTTFVPDSDWQTAELASAYEASSRQWTYLGDWHTHPSGTGRLSLRDARTLRRIARTPGARAPRAISAILVPATDHSEERLAVWRAGARRRTPERLPVATYMAD